MTVSINNAAVGGNSNTSEVLTGVTDSSGNNAELSVVSESSEVTIIDDNANGFKYISTAPKGSNPNGTESVWSTVRISSTTPQVIDHSAPNIAQSNRVSETYS